MPICTISTMRCFIIQESSGSSVLSFDQHGSIKIEESFTLDSTGTMNNLEEEQNTKRLQEQKVLSVNVPTYLKTSQVR